MANKEAQQRRQTLADLSEGALKELEDMEAYLDEAQSRVEALRSVGVDASRLEQKIRDAREVKRVILETYGPQK